ncbi:MAG: helix-hairpin-helix domain-containing protein [Ilumatobacteraceae bacterium]
MEPTPPAPLLPRPSPGDRLVERISGWLAWFGLVRLLVAGASVVLVAVAAWWLLRAPRPSTESQLPYASVPSTSSSPPTSAGDLPPPSTASEVVVHVAGAVVAPGVYHLPASSRVVDAIVAAGGLAPTAATDSLNLAEPVRDGVRVYVPQAGEAASVAAGVSGGEPASTARAGPIDVNTATAEQLDALPGVGPSTAAAIIAYRDAHGPFAIVDDLGEVRGIGPAKLDALRELVTT